jgi:hypothetical protein
MWDPKWYRRNGKPYIDSRGVINGFRCDILSPSFTEPDLFPCPYHKVGLNSECKFITQYINGLNDIDIDKVTENIDTICNKVSEITNFIMTPVLLVYETPSNPCSERLPIMNYFKSHNLDISEFDPNKSYIDYNYN